MFLDLDDLTMHLRTDGPQDAPVLLMLHSLGTDHGVWDPQAAVLSRNFRVVRPDLRGHGLTGVTAGPYSIKGLAEDALCAMNRLGIMQAHVAGLSIGGMVGQALAAVAPSRVSSLVLCDTAMSIPPPGLWRDRAATVRASGTTAIADAVVARWVTPAAADTPETHRLRSMVVNTASEGYAGAAEAIAAADLASMTPSLRVPVLIAVGDQDVATPIAAAQHLAGAIAGSELSVIMGASHIPTFERSNELTGVIKTFLQRQLS
ncbi:3-oxoadipate enol-lactonase [Phyllobacterium brassicacearum]|uniref:3-oxoadipate enol-lactonase n=1 Tax=Phyllobacterium brassicacearum TaxID=314235 RepID=A0A2P7BVD4_9HYPH|nr:alpha/beta fold hydrolase [Phyllobacterium brassicacearum]PSH70434.1 3-oxoadipate enol-lactonase [Phyllobacterium brassicacearum]TDQ27959.1 3-oxoadipate enol-lactonase [Phyllobacterium brassicacearum]